MTGDPTPEAPVCCGQAARWVVQSVSLAYWFCDECKKEAAWPVLEEAPSLAPSTITIRNTLPGCGCQKCQEAFDLARALPRILQVPPQAVQANPQAPISPAYAPLVIPRQRNSLLPDDSLDALRYMSEAEFISQVNTQLEQGKKNIFYDMLEHQNTILQKYLRACQCPRCKGADPSYADDKDCEDPQEEKDDDNE